MLESCKSAQERWGGVHQLIDRWLQGRFELIAAYKALLEQLPDARSQDIRRFCQLLVDYVSAGHFEVYEQLINEARAFGDQRGLALVNQLFPRLQVTTEAALAFNDRCDTGECRKSADYADQLRRLGTHLHERFELEDCLIEVLHNAHRQQRALAS